jgi:[FeFe] hydrogenase H-cluster maturation GTPase HydF
MYTDRKPLPLTERSTLNSTPSANRVHIAIYGNRNVGKSSLLNAIVGQDVAIVSDVKGTTTDPVLKTMELLPFGPVVFIDTAGLDDDSVLGALRVDRTKKILQRTDFALLVHDLNDFDETVYAEARLNFKKYHIPYLLVFNKMDLMDQNALLDLKKKHPEAVVVSTKDMKSIHQLKTILIRHLESSEKETPIIGDFIPYGGTVVMVVPIDSEAPKGRIILPQVQLIRDCLDHGIKAYVVRDTELEDALTELKRVDLVVTDSQAFERVSQIVPAHIPLTSFSIVFARYKGDLKTFIDGTQAIRGLKDGSRILISESCTHNHSHEDIGRVKIPMLLDKKEGKKFNYVFRMGHDFPEDLETYDLIVHCGSCMLNKKTMLTRIQLAHEAGVPITNYGVLLAYVTDILDRTTEIEGM